MAKKGQAWRVSQALQKSDVVPDEMLITNGKIKPLPPDHWCDGCGLATRLQDRFMCPLVEGSCARLPGSLEKPDPELLHNRIKYDRIYTEAHKEVFDDISGN